MTRTDEPNPQGKTGATKLPSEKLAMRQNALLCSFEEMRSLEPKAVLRDEAWVQGLGLMEIFSDLALVAEEPSAESSVQRHPKSSVIG